MASARQVLRGVSCRDTRDVLEQLVEEGWTPEHSRGGHIRLTHADAAHPIISAKTPSTARGRLNLKSEARRAIKLGRNDILSTTLLHSAIPPLEPANIEGIPTAPSERLKKRWSKERRQAERAKEKKFLPAAPAPTLDLKSSLSPSLIPAASSAKGQMPKAAAPVAGASTTGGVAAKAAAPKARANAKSKMVTPVVVAKPEPVIAPAAPAAPVQPVSTERANVLGGVPVIGADVIAMAMRILSGQVSTLQITPDMVGMTLVHEGPVQLLDGLLPGIEPKAVIPAAAPRQAAPARAKVRMTAQGDAQRRFDLVRTALAVDPEAWLTHIDVADLISDDAAYGCRRSLMGATKRMLGVLVEAGEVEVDEGGAGEMHGYRPARP